LNVEKFTRNDMQKWQVFEDEEEQLFKGSVEIDEKSTPDEIILAINNKFKDDWLLAYPCNKGFTISKRLP